MSQAIEGTLYIDEQAKAPVTFCPKCLGALYAPSLVCLRCRRDTP